MNITFVCVKCDEPVGEIRMSKCPTCGKYGIGGYICDECDHEETFDVIAGHTDCAALEKEIVEVRAKVHTSLEAGRLDLVASDRLSELLRQGASR